MSIRKSTVFIAVGFLALAGASYAQQGIQVGFTVGGSIPMSGDVSYAVDIPGVGFEVIDDDFTNVHKAGYSFGGYGAGPISGVFGWRAEMSYERMPVKEKSREISDMFEQFDGNYKVFRFQGGIQIAPWESQSMPYGFFTLGFAREDANLSGRTLDGVDFQYDLGSTTKFGMSFGGGYDYTIGENWGVGGDIHFNYGRFDSSNRWWWSPTAKIFAKF